MRKVEYTSGRLGRECIPEFAQGFNGNQTEFLREIIYRTALNLGLDHIDIQREDVHLNYVLAIVQGALKYPVASFRCGISASSRKKCSFDAEVIALGSLEEDKIIGAMNKAVTTLENL